jgi:hypothetical protein
MEAIWIALGGNAAFLLVVAFLGKGLVSQWLEKDLQRCKDQLASDSARELEGLKSRLSLTANSELERLKSELALVASEHSIMLSRLQERRAQVIGDLYSKIAIATRLTSSFVSPMQWVWEQSQMNRAAEARDALTTAQNAFEENRIWLTESCAKCVDALVTELRGAYNQLAVWVKHEKGLTDQVEERKTKSWMDSWEAVCPQESKLRGGHLNSTLRGSTKRPLDLNLRNQSAQ